MDATECWLQQQKQQVLVNHWNIFFQELFQFGFETDVANQIESFKAWFTQAYSNHEKFVRHLGPYSQGNLHKFLFFYGTF